MRGYRIIEKDKTFFFQLIPLNNNIQPIGQSKKYDTEKECIEAVKEFRTIIKNNNINSLSSKYVIYEREKNKRRFKICFNNDIIYKSRFYVSNYKTNTQKSISAIFNNIDEYTTNRKEV